MQIDAAQADLNSRFTYSADGGDSWRILSGSGAVAGDCEDYSLTLIWLAEGRSLARFWLALIMFKYVIWFCHSPGGYGHAVVWCRGSGWTDNIQREFVPSLRAIGYKMRFPFLPPFVAVKFMLRPLMARRKI